MNDATSVIGDVKHVLDRIPTIVCRAIIPSEFSRRYGIPLTQSLNLSEANNSFLIKSCTGEDVGKFSAEQSCPEF